MRASKFSWERETQRSPASSLGRHVVYFEILGFSIRCSQRESAMSGGLALCVGIEPGWPRGKPGLLAAGPPGARG